jgi:phosphate transport system permease protein
MIQPSPTENGNTELAMTNQASVLKNLDEVRAMIKRHKRNDYIFAVIGLIAIMIGLLTLLTLFVDLVMDGYPRFNTEFLTNFPSRRAGQAGLMSAWVGSMLVMLVTCVSAVPMGVAAGIYLEEYAPKNWFSDIIEINVTNLAGVPSIVYGLLALGLFVYALDLGQSIVSAGLTLGLLILPIVIVSTREAIRRIPVAIREAA